MTELMTIIRPIHTNLSTLCIQYALTENYTNPDCIPSRAISINKRNVDAYIGKAKSLSLFNISEHFDENIIDDGIKACDIGLAIGPKRDKAKVLHRLKGNLLEIKSEIVVRNKKYKNPRRDKISLLFKAVDEYQAAMHSRSFNGGEELSIEAISRMAFNELTKEYFMIARDELNRLHKLYPKDKKIEETLLSLCNYPGSLVNEICKKHDGDGYIDVFKLGSDYARSRVKDRAMDQDEGIALQRDLRNMKK